MSVGSSSSPNLQDLTWLEERPTLPPERLNDFPESESKKYLTVCARRDSFPILVMPNCSPVDRPTYRTCYRLWSVSFCLLMRCQNMAVMCKLTVPGSRYHNEVRCNSVGMRTHNSRDCVETTSLQSFCNLILDLYTEHCWLLIIRHPEKFY
jgi:hypothetical protein